MSAPARFIVLFGPTGFADRVGGLPGPPEMARHAAADAADLLRELASDSLAMVVVHHDSVGILPALRPQGPQQEGELSRPAPLVVVGCPDASCAAAALAAGADAALRADAEPGEVAAACRSVLQLAELSRLSLKDDLTTAWNRRYFERCLSERIDHATRTSSPLSLIFMDIDNLKAVNARHGHPMGSHVLREVATRLIGAVRGSDAVMRYGGDEFCIVLPGLGLTEAIEVAERLREAVAGQAFAVDASTKFSLTASFGVASYPDHAKDLAGLVAAADGAMIAIKDRQKNGISVAGAA